MVDNVGYNLNKAYTGLENYAGIGASGNNKAPNEAGPDIKADAPSGIGKTSGTEKCQTCRTRKYQDGSNDPGVSFKSPTALDPAQAATAVYSHEREHYSREQGKAESEGKEVVSNDIVLFSDVCPECGKTYVSGGETTTVTRQKAESAGFAKDFFDKTVGAFLPKIMDVKA